eukprot:CAMPEP_0172559784 /NCGR_PEP_ID=MMETSP1067-20121228/85655_1 /TAXON_ID=265564 ORGANISM="Thalassiosira punctigera, Strain Tpunct2005C2" /NCGR_SAMPLE_ID=MMETSP1067 /ASSEMBLY_ACC=CAM_ASM_000444 /LENGTH=94 /DNA_ID=CAMNT_0013349451 /DNA_START=78 /DNA_END=362 /DNA_ORIENTATION=+
MAVPSKNANPKTIRLPLNRVQGVSLPRGVVMGFVAVSSTSLPARVSKATLTSPQSDFSRFFLACMFRPSNNSSETAMPDRPVSKMTYVGVFLSK